MILITGCARSGTGYAHVVLRALGKNVGHEDIKNDGTSSWCLAAHKSQSPWGNWRGKKIQIEDIKPKFKVILHQVRDPLFAISSQCGVRDNSPDGSRTWDWICKQVPIPRETPMLERCIMYWYYWNLMAEEQSVWTYKVEDLELNLEKFCEHCGAKVNREAVAKVSKRYNSRRRGEIYGILKVPGGRGPVTAQEVEEACPELFPEVQKLAERYGYSSLQHISTT